MKRKIQREASGSGQSIGNASMATASRTEPMAGNVTSTKFGTATASVVRPEDRPATELGSATEIELTQSYPCTQTQPSQGVPNEEV